ncbi:MAG: DHH family phosphoesterase [Bacteroidales bacterium]|jgi:phosphoesterase RecJ-like protein|nr:DHH family phosphoesterase [Bacteroidales bacterium]
MGSVDFPLLTSKIADCKYIAIVAHYNPDGDALGSALALYHYHQSKGNEVSVIVPNDFPDFLKWMPGNETVVVAEGNANLVKHLMKQADLLYIVDMNSPSRAGQQLEDKIIDSKAFKILIDHHVNPNIECDFQYSFPKASSTAQLVYEFLFKVLKNPLHALTLEMAECLYVGLITDTGSLTYSCNDPFLYTILSRLIKKGVDGEHIHRLVYDNYGASRLKLLGIALGHRLVILPEYQSAYMSLSKKDLEDNNYQIGDTEGFVNYGLSISTVDLSAIIIEREKRIKLSFRSKGNVDVRILAERYFNGGGHRNASAAYNYDTFENTIAYLEQIIKEHHDEFFLP